MSKNKTIESVNNYVKIADVFLVGAYNHMEDIKKILKKSDVHIKLALDLAQANVASSIRTLDCMIKGVE